MLHGWLVSDSSPVTPAVDIYSFGMAALEMAALEIPGNGDSGNVVTQEQVKTLLSASDISCIASHAFFITACVCLIFTIFLLF